jgi:LmbE family N-acetylglucosaminyl deacetylase
MTPSRPTDVFVGTTLVFAPHMDDCVLGCGGTLAGLPDRSGVHMVYVTDGCRSPAPEIPWRDEVTASLRAVREGEARTAMTFLGLPPENVHFLGLPDGRLRSVLPRLHEVMEALVERLRPDVVLAPFRFDRHPDHLAVHEAATSLLEHRRSPRSLLEFFVYSRWNLLPGRDVRRYLAPDRMMEIDLSDVAATKRAALEMFRSQTTRYFSWQSRPVLDAALLERVCREPERFLMHDPEQPGVRALTGARLWIPIAHRLEPLLEKPKDRALALWRRRSWSL